MTPRALVLAQAAVLLAACATTPPPPTTGGATPARMVVERYVSAEAPQEELDSLATWPTEDGHTWLIASAKSTHRLVVFDADTGERLRTVGEQGRALGRFDRPNGVAVYGDHLFVVERDNRRVQVFALPEFAPLGSFGEAELRSPHGLWINETAPGELEVYVTDSFMYGPRHDRPPPPGELDQRVRRYRVRLDPAGRLLAHYGGAFGDTGEAALREVESIAGDAASGRLLIADEGLSDDPNDRRGSTLREYSFEGEYTGRSLPQGSFGAEAEGVALWACPDGSGYWIAADQLAPSTVFRLFDRESLATRGSFHGESTAHTDGIALHAASTAAFPFGALFAVHDDKAVAAFDLVEVARVLDLPPGCIG